MVSIVRRLSWLQDDRDTRCGGNRMIRGQCSSQKDWVSLECDRFSTRMLRGRVVVDSSSCPPLASRPKRRRGKRSRRCHKKISGGVHVTSLSVRLFLLSSVLGHITACVTALHEGFVDFLIFWTPIPFAFGARTTSGMFYALLTVGHLAVNDTVDPIANKVLWEIKKSSLAHV